MSYVIVHARDGDTDVERLTDVELNERLNTKDGTTYYGRDLHFITKDELAHESTPDYWGKFGGNCLLILKGDVVVPQPKEVVLTWTL